MKFILIIIFSSSGLDSYSVATQEFDNQDACIHAVGVVREEIMKKHGAVTMTLRCVPKGYGGSVEDSEREPLNRLQDSGTKNN